MFTFLALLSLAAASAHAALIPAVMIPLLDGRIVGGSATPIAQFPYQISLQYRGRHVCGGSILNERTIVTAAHCLDSSSAESLKIRAGSTYCNSGGSVVQVKSITIHPDFSMRDMVNDIGLLHLASPLVLSGNIKAIEMATTTPSNNASAVVTGWGVDKSGGSLQVHLQEVDVKMIDQSQCASSQYGYDSAVKDGMICAANSGKDSCQGDSGGPLVIDGRQVGIVSWGYGCADAKFPGVYTNVADFHSWITKNA